MNRIEIKEEAKKILNGNMWNLWKPIVVVWAISICAACLFGTMIFTDSIFLAVVLVILLEIALMPLSIGILRYTLNIVRGKKFSVNDLYKPYHNIWVIVGVMFLQILIIMAGFLLFYIPGIILTYMYVMSNFILADGEKDIVDTLRKSREMMRGYKLEYFVFVLSFIGWFLLIPFTFGIVALYVVPYFQAANAIYYDRLKKKYEGK